MHAFGLLSLDTTSRRAPICATLVKQWLTIPPRPTAPTKLRKSRPLRSSAGTWASAPARARTQRGPPSSPAIALVAEGAAVAVKNEVDILEVLERNPEASRPAIRDLCERFKLGDEWRRIESLLGDAPP